MKVRLRLFAQLRDTVGGDFWECDLSAEARVGDLRAAIAAAFPALANLLRSSAFAVAAEYVPDDFPLKEGVEVACIPPVSGG
jgi:molybdopterin converting factor small subunit